MAGMNRLLWKSQSALFDTHRGLTAHRNYPSPITKYPGRSTHDNQVILQPRGRCIVHLITLRQTMGYVHIFYTPMIFVFLDLEVAFSSVDCALLSCCLIKWCNRILFLFSDLCLQAAEVRFVVAARLFLCLPGDAIFFRVALCHISL